MENPAGAGCCAGAASYLQFLFLKGLCKMWETQRLGPAWPKEVQIHTVPFRGVQTTGLWPKPGLVMSHSCAEAASESNVG